MPQERRGAFNFAGQNVTLLGPELHVGDKAPEFEVIDNNLKAVSLRDFQGKVRIVSVVPSLDTGVCDTQTRKFNEAASNLGNHVVILTVSADLPFAQKRWCGAAGVERVHTLSDYRQMSFGDAYGTHIKEVRLESRAVFVVDSKDVVQYVQYVPSAGEEPDYESALAAAKAAQ